MSERVVALLVDNRLLLATSQSRTSCLLFAAAARISRYPSSLSTVLEGIILPSTGTAVGAEVSVP